MKITNIYQIIEKQSKAHPEKIALYLPNDEILSYRDLNKRTAQFCHYFKNKGLTPQDRVAIVAEKSYLTLIVYLACLRSNLICLPLNPAFTENELNYFFEDAKPSLICCDNSTKAKFSQTHRNQTMLELNEQWVDDKLTNISVEYNTVSDILNECAAIIYTSGTTGQPKGAILTHHNLIQNGLNIKQSWEFSSQDVLLHCLPTYHVHGLLFAHHCALFSGASMIYLPKFEVNQVLEHLPQATVFMGVPTFYNRLINSPRLTTDLCQNIRLFISGSAPLQNETFELFKRKTGYTLIERYGMTETGIISSNLIDGTGPMGTVGTSLDNQQLRVVDDSQNPITIGEVGYVQVKGDNI